MQIPKEYHKCPRCQKETFISKIEDKTFRVSCLCCSDEKWHVDLPIEDKKINADLKRD